ncbi:protein mono-ADP-ribosyltransferase TIPARP [Microcaecilia unicolor]|uniref:Protein mono-ADP-ribosyltransferase TIPARP n=1 Tax=Microcaecilia unicolor TaxID=1415580 RepID=A0A6P7Z097_9AMPH|nr:protein mono-ADP-ribosyltransferase TIPARP [Microcaecilia unicolor]XP_030072767.1 protein mono-ADP-ribosyltransferase TIPARP [Microcaecilia unicolor]XP_030072768.1 protein mono-ADP-ribosyltransferase TIPARP [Microcaecilia unicolor]
MAEAFFSTVERSLQLMEAQPGAAACVARAQYPGMKRSEATDDQFPPSRRLGDKIPPVKPTFKKKPAPKRLDTETLRALGPIFSSLLGAGALDGVFLPRTQSANPATLCEPAAKAALGMAPQASALLPATQSLVATRPDHSPPERRDPEAQPGLIEESSAENAADSANGAFQDPPLLHPGANPAASPLCSDGASDFCLSRCSLHQPPGPDAGMFQDKTEEASLLLVFELLNQLQYHIYQEDGIDVCVDFLRGSCGYGSDCPKHHTVLPYHWQVRRKSSGTWQSVADESQEHLERLYCNPDSDRIRLKYQGQEFLVDLNFMSIYESAEFDQIRRLSTVSCTSPNSNYHTIWKYFCRDHFGWREYSEPVVRLIEEANCRGVKEVRFVTWHNQYILNIKDGFQQNACFRREIKKRPLFRSSVMLAPHLQTLGGFPASAVEAASSQVSSPTAATSFNFYPETWISMDPSQEFIQVPVPKDDKSYRTVYNLFHKTVPETKFRIVKILRVQNLFLWEKYKRKKEFMSKKMTGLDKIMNERHLFHGTSQDVVDGICKHNFDPRVCGKHATMYGQGSYFARKASYSHNFSKQSSKGVHYMFLAKVLTGRYTVGNHTMRRPPPLNPGIMTSDLYDSCVDNYFEPQIFVIFNDDQSYPYFVIQYEEVSNTVPI